MCLILFAYKMHPEFDLIVAANRDEFLQRPTAAAHFWNDHPEILAGRDLKQMGTWMGTTTKGRFSALTNYRDPDEETTGKQSRGELVANALTYPGEIKEYMMSVNRNHHHYTGFNLLAGSVDELYYFSNINKSLKTIEPGIHGLSNHLLNSAWPKVMVGKEGLSKILFEKPANITEHLFNLLKTVDPAPDELLPNTGVPIELERILSPLFIKTEDYGTRSPTVLLMNQKEANFIERVFAEDRVEDSQFKIQFD